MVNLQYIVKIGRTDKEHRCEKGLSSEGVTFMDENLLNCVGCRADDGFVEDL